MPSTTITTITVTSITTMTELAYLRLLHLADSAFPIGALAHSFGIESLASAGVIDPASLPHFLSAYIEESLTLEAVFCRAGSASAEHNDTAHWLRINQNLHARKTGREARSASAALGQRFLLAAMALLDSPTLENAYASSLRTGTPVHHCVAFGLVGALLGVEQDRVVLAYVHQSAANIVSACQRLMPLGQTQATRILWNLKAAMIDAMEGSRDHSVDDVPCFAPLVDWGAMEHPALATRLFIS